MARTLVTGPAPMSRAARIGGQAGEGFASAFAPAFQEQQELTQNIEQFEPIRNALQQQLGTGPVATPMQQTLQQLVGDPESFARVMTDPNALNSMATVQTLAQPEEEEEQFPELAEISEAMNMADQFDEDGETRRAEIMRARAADMAGIEQAEMSDIARQIREMDLDPSRGRGRELMEAHILGTQKASQRQIKIGELTERGLDRNLAADLVDGQAYIDTSDPVRPKFVNDNTGEIREIPQGVANWAQSSFGAGQDAQAGQGAGAAAAAPASDPNQIRNTDPPLGAEPMPVSPEEGQTLYDMAEVATGPVASLQRAMSVPLDIMGLPIAEREIKFKQAFNSERSRLMQAFAVNPDQRMAVQEMDWIRNELNIQPGAFKGAQTLRAQLEQLDVTAKTRAQDHLNRAQNPQLAPADRNSAMLAATALQEFRQVLGAEPHQAPDQEGGQQQGAPQQEGTQEGADALPPEVPEGSQQIGETAAGLPIYQLPDGSTRVLE